MEFGASGSQGLQFCGGRSGNHRRCSEGERMLTEKDSAYVLLLGLGLWIADRAVQELRRLREELAQIRIALQQQDLLAAARRGLGAASSDAVKRPVSGAFFHPPPPVRVLGARPAQQHNATAQARRRSGGVRAA